MPQNDDADGDSAEHDDYKARPDPDEPWRYVCPACGSVDLHHNVAPTTDERRFRCKRCDWYGRESELVDRAAARD